MAGRAALERDVQTLAGLDADAEGRVPVEAKPIDGGRGAPSDADRRVAGRATRCGRASACGNAGTAALRGKRRSALANVRTALARCEAAPRGGRSALNRTRTAALRRGECPACGEADAAALGGRSTQRNGAAASRSDWSLDGTPGRVAARSAPSLDIRTDRFVAEIAPRLEQQPTEPSSPTRRVNESHADRPFHSDRLVPNLARVRHELDSCRTLLAPGG